MGEPFKNLLGAAQVDWLAGRLAAAWPDFLARRFRAAAKRGLEALELKARARHVADALEATLPADKGRAFTLLVAAMESPLEVTQGYGGSVFRYLPVSEYLERHGLADVEAALRANYELTQRFSSEFCVRPLLLGAPGPTLAALAAWAGDPNPHVRRLVSEGTRPRLPWGRQLPPFIADPSPVLPLLERLRDDESEYVRRSVANNLNDIAKDHPEVVLTMAKRWLRGATPARRRLVEHGLRTLLKRGDARALALVGAGDAAALEVRASLAPKRVALGGRVTFSATLTNTSARAVHAVVEARVHFVKAKGTSVKPFRVARVDLGAGETVEVSKGLALEHRSVRRLFAGRHEVELQVNGVRRPLGAFTLTL
jgi:3-methyladenine DNA glycosylase AlkC